MAIERITILEFAPTADEIWHISHHVRDGYAHYNAAEGLLSLMDTAHHAKQRPEIVTIYAGGKATNVARVLDRLMTDEDDPDVQLVTFLPPATGNLRQMDFGDVLQPSTAAGIYVQCLQLAGLSKVKPRFEIIDELEESGKMQATRRCIELTWSGSAASVNFSPRIVWSQDAAAAVIGRVADVVHGADIVVLAGAPPVWEETPGSNFTRRSFYAQVMEALDPECRVSVDARGEYLIECLRSSREPRFILMNTEEFGDLSSFLEEAGDRKFPGTFLIHDESGCWVWDGEIPKRQDSFSEAQFFAAMEVSTIYSTIGAGDAMHAGFLREWVRSGSMSRAVAYSQVVAGVSVSNEKATHGIDVDTVHDKFQQVWNS